MDGRRRLAIQLLVEDRFEQRLEGRLRPVEAQHENSRPLDQRAQLGVNGAQMRDSRGGVEGKLWALAVMDHRRTVYRAGSRPWQREPFPSRSTGRATDV